MLVNRLLVLALATLFSLSFAGLALAADIGSEAGNYEFVFDSADETRRATDRNLDSGVLVDLGTEAGDWDSSIVDIKALQAARSHDYDRNRLSNVGTEAGNYDFSFDRREMRPCDGMLC
ncbi:MAG: hypothetical protein C0624_01095 [Desulfuromonas sp.]|nr:MAG: hypothetical protein C0624_01095 [Desulfuromonas sp.]